MHAYSVASLIKFSGMSILVGDEHDWPVLKKHCLIPISTAFSKSASSRIIFGDFPPNSNETLLILSAACFCISIPARVEPVKDIISKSSCWLIALPTISPLPCIRLKIPFGKEVLSTTSARR